MNFVALGLTIMIVSQAATIAHIEPFWSWNTPIAWTGFIVFADGIVWRARRSSWMRSNAGEFVFLALVSIPLWLVFEFYNRFIENWYYIGLPENMAVRYFGYAWAFATICPAIFAGAELVGVWRRAPSAHRHITQERRPLSASMGLSIAVGVVLLLWPLIWPSRYLAAPVFLGFIFLLDPINARLGAESLARDIGMGNYDRLLNLLLSGLLCGALWEFWNYWSRSKWHYTVPIMERWKIFEMPLPGYFGFPPFALECFTMYVFVRTIVGRYDGRERPIGL